MRLLLLLLCALASGRRASCLQLEEVEVARQGWERGCLSRRGAGKGEAGDPRLKVSPKCVVFYLHNHKTGGSTMCKTAQVNGLKISGLADNCNVPLKVRLDKSINSQEYVFDKKIQFIAQEDKPFHINESNTKFVYMTTFRNPLDRLVSHLHHEFCGHGATQLKQRLESHTCSGNSGTLSDLIHDPCFSNSRMRAITTDYYVAMMTGCVNRLSDGKGGFTPPQQNTCGEKHLEEAKMLLNFFSVILISDNSADFDRYGELLDLKFSIVFKEQYRTGTHVNSENLVAQLLRHNDTSRHIMEMVTSLDMQLYEYAKELAETRLTAAQSDLEILRAFRKVHPARRRRLQPTHSSPEDLKSRGRHIISELKNNFAQPDYIEGPLC